MAIWNTLVAVSPRAASGGSVTVHFDELRAFRMLNEPRSCGFSHIPPRIGDEELTRSSLRRRQVL